MLKSLVLVVLSEHSCHLHEARSGNARNAGQEVKAAEEGVEAASKAGKFLKCAGKCAGVVGGGVDVGIRSCEACQVEQEYRNGTISQKERLKSHVKNGGSFVGGMGGAAAGVYGGAAVGAAIGSVVPGPGTAIGGFVGGLAGAIGGYLGGDQVVRAGIDACWK